VSTATATTTAITAAATTSKGRITIPVDVRRASRDHCGDRFEIRRDRTGQVRDHIAANGFARELKGMFGPARRHVSNGEMREAIAAARSSTV